VINERTQQGDDLRVCATLELVSGEAPGDPGDKVRDLHSRFTPGIDELDIGQLVSGLACGEVCCDVCDPFWG
jgi:hypothetical protein